MKTLPFLDRRIFCAGALAFLAGANRLPCAMAATPDATGVIDAMAKALQTASAVSFSAEYTFGAMASGADMLQPGNMVSVSFLRGRGLLAAYGSGGPDIHLLVRDGEAVLFRPSLAIKSVIPVMEGAAAAFAIDRLFLPFMGLLAADVKEASFGKITSVIAIAQGQPDQPETTRLVAVMAERFTGEIWVDMANGLPVRMIGTYFDGKGGVAASAAATYSDWKMEALATLDFDDGALAAFKTVEPAALGI